MILHKPIWKGGKKPAALPDKVPEATFKTVEDVEAFLKLTGADIREGGNSAFHERSTGMIRVPAKGQFLNEHGYYSTLFHELTHWTGSAERLNRDKNGRFGDPKYAFEELVAELGAAFLCARFGIDNDGTNSAAYLQSWCKALKDHKKMLFSAAKLAREAVEFLTKDMAKSESIAA